MKTRYLIAIVMALLSLTACKKEAAVEEMPTAAGPEGGQSAWTLPGADEAARGAAASILLAPMLGSRREA